MVFRALSATASTASPTRLVLVRHAATGHTADGRYSGRTDVPLSAAGVAQAQRLAAGLADEFPAALATSPLNRCVETAAPVATALGLDATPDPDLAECNFGHWDGLTFAEAHTGWPAEHAAWLASTAVAPPGGESFDAVAARVRRFVDRARARHPGAALVVVSHTAPLKLLLRDALSAGPAMLHTLVLDPAGVSVVDVWPDGGVAVPRVNDTCHLR
jgi:probable phosphoglycerate mutase